MLFDVPVVPDADQARRWLERELADPAYRDRESLLERLWNWLDDLFGSLSLGGGANPWWLLAIVLLVAAIVLTVFWVAGPVRRAASGTPDSARVLADDDLRDATALRAAADAAAQAGDWTTAVAERFRALVRALEDRALLDDQPGRTAREAAEAAAQHLPGQADGLHRASNVFDAVVYGHRAAGPQDDAELRALDRAVSQARVSAR